MRLLILGGTGWLGGHIARDALAAGHAVTCLVRGTEVPAGATLVRADRDFDDALAAVATERWDAVIDVSRAPGQVRRAVRDLEPVAERFVFISTVNVYASVAEPGVTEDAPLTDPLDPGAETGDYPAAKVACERAVLAGFGPERTVILRAGLIAGPEDPTGRTTYWPWRFAHPADATGDVLVPDDPDRLTSVIDVRDLSAWAVRLATTSGAHGVFNATGATTTLREHLLAAKAAAGHRGRIVAAAPAWLIDHDVQQWMGERSLPLWIHDADYAGMGAVSNARALAAGLRLRPLAATLGDALTVAHLPGAGLTDDDETKLRLALATSGGPQTDSVTR